MQCFLLHYDLNLGKTYRYKVVVMKDGVVVEADETEKIFHASEGSIHKKSDRGSSFQVKAEGFRKEREQCKIVLTKICLYIMKTDPIYFQKRKKNNMR